MRKRTHEDDTRVAVAGPDALCFRTPPTTRGEDMRTVSEFAVDEGERVPFVLTWFPSHEEVPEAIDPEQALADTESFWREWSEACPLELPGDWRDARAALAHRAQGADLRADRRDRRRADDVAARVDRRRAQLGLPLLLAARRDAHAARPAPLQTTPTRRAQWRRWLLRAVAGDPADLQIMYGVAGERRLTEFELPWLAGYEGSQPVRVGNAASEQLQLDVYGEVLDALLPGARARARRSTRRRGRIQLGAARAPRRGVARAGRRASGRSAASAATSPTRR